MINDEIKHRQEAESAFHDKKLSGDVKRNYYSAGFTGTVFSALMERLGNIEDKRVLEFGCGIGWLTKILASRGAHVWAFDISQEAVNNTREKLAVENFKYTVHLDRMGAEELQYESNMFDLIVGNAILHHVDLETTLREIHRVLKSGGTALFLEPLGHNPLLNLYRALTPGMRSRDERPLRFEQFKLIEAVFPAFDHQEYYLTALCAIPLNYLGLNKAMLKARDRLVRLDRFLLNVIPGMSKYCWYSLLIMSK